MNGRLKIVGKGRNMKNLNVTVMMRNFADLLLLKCTLTSLQQQQKTWPNHLRQLWRLVKYWMLGYRDNSMLITVKVPMNQ
jgi:hypothetical protein